jgi:hypothetical protein
VYSTARIGRIYSETIWLTCPKAIEENATLVIVSLAVSPEPVAAQPVSRQLTAVKYIGNVRASLSAVPASDFNQAEGCSRINVLPVNCSGHSAGNGR